ncbi:hypothetical protein [Solirubrobacter soli]|uniref:hypothetical protein n=1 Tax=Solirubrobacter soli TaxID=363832 RepID=UPI0004271169|nr:hypothetical protein [Solirubrobacter soli]
MARRNALAAATLLGALVLVALHFWRGIEYWNYSEGVYVYTSQLLLHGGDLYGHTVVAQPPWQFLFGAGALGIHDSLTFLRLAVGLAQLGAGVLAAVAVWRLTESPWATIAAPPLMLLTPWAVREHGALTPELLAPPVLLGAALLAARPKTAGYAGALAAVAPFIKWPYALPLLAIVLFSAAPKRAAIGAAVSILIQAVVFTGVFGFGLWDDSVLAQMASGRRGLDVLKGVWGQAFWSLVGLVAIALLVWRERARLKDAPLFKVLAALAVAMLATLITNTKDGTGLNVIVPIEAALVPIALSAVALTNLRWVVPVALAFTLVQSLSLVLQPRTATPFIYPTSQRGAWGRDSDTAQVKAAVAKAVACPPGVVYSGPPFIAFLADRKMPDDQPDQFLPSRSTRLADVQKAMDAVQPRCG